VCDVCARESERVIVKGGSDSVAVVVAGGGAEEGARNAGYYAVSIYNGGPTTCDRRRSR
jgi:hypothetical protein